MILHLLVVVLYIFPHCICRGSVDCDEYGGEVPVPILNSPYKLLPNSSLCCPEFAGNSCADEKSIASKCGGGLVFEPCHFCKTCAKLAGEECGGIQNIYGSCNESLECVYENENSTTGICYHGKGKHVVFEVCLYHTSNDCDYMFKLHYNNN